MLRDRKVNSKSEFMKSQNCKHGLVFPENFPIKNEKQNFNRKIQMLK